MTIDRGFSLSASVITTETGSSTDESVTLVDSYDISASVSTGPIEGGTDETGAILTADATAIGEDSLAVLSAEGTATSGTIATSTEVSMTSEAVASSTDQAYASTYGEIELIGGAEYSFSLDYDAAIVDQDEGGTVASSTSIDYLYALTIDESAIAGTTSSSDPADVDSSAEPDLVSPDLAVSDQPCGCDDNGLVLDGNVAVYDINLVTFGDESFIDASVYALAVDDQMSSVTMSSVIVVA